MSATSLWLPDAHPGKVPFLNIGAGNHEAQWPGPVGEAFVLLSVDYFYYGGFANPDLQIEDEALGVALANWRPETANVQSYHLSLWQPFASGSPFHMTVGDGAFDVLLGGFYVASGLVVG